MVGVVVSVRGLMKWDVQIRRVRLLKWDVQIRKVKLLKWCRMLTTDVHLVENSQNNVYDQSFLLGISCGLLNIIFFSFFFSVLCSGDAIT